MRTFFASAFRISCASLLAVALYLGATYVSVQSVGKQALSRNADVIVVLGAAQYDGTPSPLLRLRLEHALDLFKAGRASLIAVTGGKQQADRFTEAATSRRWLTDHGVPRANIIEETTGRSTWQSLSNLAPQLRAKGVRSVIVSTSQWHVQRCVLSLRELGFTVFPSGAPSTLNDSNKLMKETIGVSIGRIVGFERLFHITG